MKSITTVLFLLTAFGTAPVVAGGDPGQSLQNKYAANTHDTRDTASALSMAWKLEIAEIDAKIRLGRVTDLGFAPEELDTLSALTALDLREVTINAMSPYFDEMCYALDTNSVDIVSMAGLIDVIDNSEATASIEAYEAIAMDLSRQSQRLLSHRIEKRRASRVIRKIDNVSLASDAPEHMRDKIASMCKTFSAIKSQIGQKVSDVPTTSRSLDRRSVGPRIESSAKENE